MASVRLIALMLVIVLTGPSVGSLVCDWKCATSYTQSAAGSGCHDDGDEATPATVASAHQCHDLATPDESTMAGTPQSDLRMLPVAIVLSGDESPSSFARTQGRLSRSPHAPPPLLIPLRI